MQSGLWASVCLPCNWVDHPCLCSHPFILYWLHCMDLSLSCHALRVIITEVNAFSFLVSISTMLQSSGMFPIFLKGNLFSAWSEEVWNWILLQPLCLMHSLMPKALISKKWSWHWYYSVKYPRVCWSSCMPSLRKCSFDSHECLMPLNFHLTFMFL